MCSVCGFIGAGHEIGCPETPDVIIGECAWCGEPVREGQKVTVINGEVYCCYKDFDKYDMKDLFEKFIHTDTRRASSGLF